MVTQHCKQAMKQRPSSPALWLCNQLLCAMWTKLLRPALQKQSVFFRMSGLGIAKSKQLPLASVGGLG